MPELFLSVLIKARQIVYIVDTHHCLPSFSETVTLFEDLNNEWVSEIESVANHGSLSLGRSRLCQCPRAHSLLLNPDQRKSLHRRRQTRLRLALMRGRAVGSRTLIRQKKKRWKVQRKNKRASGEEQTKPKKGCSLVWDGSCCLFDLNVHFWSSWLRGPFSQVTRNTWYISYSVCLKEAEAECSSWFLSIN